MLPEPTRPLLIRTHRATARSNIRPQRHHRSRRANCGGTILLGDVGAFDHLTDEELVALATKKARELGIAGPHLVEDLAESRSKHQETSGHFTEKDK